MKGISGSWLGLGVGVLALLGPTALAQSPNGPQTAAPAETPGLAPQAAPVAAPAASPQTQVAPAPATPQTPAAPAAAASDELDVRWTKPYAEAVQSKADLIIVNQPLDDTMTRLELARWLTSVFEIRPQTGRKKEVPVKDVPKGPDYLNVQALLQSGIMSTYPGNQFKPNGDLTRLEALAIFDRALKLAAPAKPVTEGWLALYKDVSKVPQTGRDFIAAAGLAGLIVNVPDPARLGPDDVLTRGEMAVLVHQALVYQKKLPAVEAPVAQLKIERPTLAKIDVEPLGTRVSPGQTVTVIAQGTPGAQAKFDFGDVATGVAMQEVSPGQYKGAYKVGERDGIVNPTVTVRLDRSGLTTQAQRIAKLEVGNPQVAQQPPSDQYDIDDEPVPAQPTRRPGGFNDSYGRQAGSYGSPGRGSYADPMGRNAYNDPFARGAYNDPFGRSAYNDPAGAYDDPAAGGMSGSFGRTTTRPGVPPIATTRRSGDLFNPPAPFDPVARPSSLRIRQVGFEPANRVLNAGDVLTVSFEGDPGGKGTFRIIGYTGPIRMKEISAGMYEGTVQIGRRVNIPGGTIEVSLERNGQRTSRNIPEPINISSNP